MFDGHSYTDCCHVSFHRPHPRRDTVPAIRKRVRSYDDRAVAISHCLFAKTPLSESSTSGKSLDAADLKILCMMCGDREKQCSDWILVDCARSHLYELCLSQLFVYVHILLQKLRIYADAAYGFSEKTLPMSGAGSNNYLYVFDYKILFFV